jgi:hypothetical protein
MDTRVRSGGEASQTFPLFPWSFKRIKMEETRKYPNINNNHKFSEELIAYFPLILHGSLRKRRLQHFSLPRERLYRAIWGLHRETHKFVACIRCPGTCLPRRCQATIGGTNIQAHRLMGGIYQVHSVSAKGLWGRELGQPSHARMEAGSNTSTLTLGVVGGDEKGSLESETVKYGHESYGTRTRKWLRLRDPVAIANGRPVLSSERAPQANKSATVRQ